MRKYSLLIGLLFYTYFSFGQSVEHWVEVGLKNNPTTKAQEAKIKAFENAVESSYEWAETNIQLSAIEWMPNDLSPYFRPTISISQDIPWMGTRKTKERIANARVRSQKAQSELLITDLRQRIKEQYLELQYLHAQVNLLEKHKEELEGLSENLLIKLESGQSSAWEVILLENEVNEINGALNAAQYNIKNKKVLFELLIGSPVENIELDPLEFHTQEQLIERGEHPIIAILKAEKNELEVSKKQLDIDYAPKLNVGIHYEAAMPVEPTYLTHDMIMPTLGFSIPIWTNKKKSKQNLVNLQQESLEAQIEVEKHKLEQEIHKVQGSLNGLEINWQTKKSSIQNILDVRELLWKEYEANKVSFQEITRLETQLIKIELEQLETIKTYQQQQIYLDYLLTDLK